MLYYCPNKGINQVYPFLGRQNLNTPQMQKRRKKRDNTQSSDFLKGSIKSLQTKAVIVSSKPTKKQNVMIVPRKRQESQTAFNVKIKRRNKENTPVVQSTSNTSILLNQLSSPGRSSKANRILDFISPTVLSAFKKTKLAKTKRDLTVIKTNIQKKIYG